VVAPPLVLAHHRIEALPVEIGGDHLVAGRLERGDHGLEQRVAIAVGQRMAVHDLDQHRVTVP
jgi:hypothetical protein